MVITGITVLALIVFIAVGVSAKQHQEKKAKVLECEHQIISLTKFKNELESHNTLEDIFKIHRQLGTLKLAWNRAICPNSYGMFRTSDIANMTMDEVFLGDIAGLWTHTLNYWLSCKDEDAISIITDQYYQQVKSGIDAEITELEDKINSL